MANEAVLEAARADYLQIQQSLASQIDGVDTRVLAVEAELEQARYDLARTTVRAPKFQGQYTLFAPHQVLTRSPHGQNRSHRRAGVSPSCHATQ
jgi:multidrug efflux pump subunit AcrA (membrane-fusion protein)